MASIFRKDDQYVDKPNRNVFHKTYESNLTTKFGQIVPVFCKPVMNGETVKIDPKMNFNFLPLVFPIQNRVRASLSFFYVRNRNLWKDWMDFQFKMKDGLVPPYHVLREETYKQMMKVGGLLDHLGVPSVLHGDYTVRLSSPNNIVNNIGFHYDPYSNTSYSAEGYQVYAADGWTPLNTDGSVRFQQWDTAISVQFEEAYKLSHVLVSLFRQPIPVDDEFLFVFKQSSLVGGQTQALHLLVDMYDTDEIEVVRQSTSSDKSIISAESEQSRSGDATRPTTGNTSSRRGGVSSRQQGISNDTTLRESQTITSNRVLRTGILSISSDVLRPDGLTPNDALQNLTKDIVSIRGILFRTNEGPQVFEPIVNVQEVFGDAGVPLSELTLDSLPFPYIDSEGTLVDSDDRLHISSMPARAIESIYNSYIRNEQNNPYMINGQPEYNKYISNENGGADSDYYPIHYRNWQDDCFTTALHSPQHGDAPLVGLVNQSDVDGGTSVRVTFANDDGTKTRVRFTALADRNDPGNSRGIILTSALEGTNSSNVPKVPSEAYVGELQDAAMEAVKFGITINDLRNVNSFQRWLENNVRKGYKYRDQIKAHFGVPVQFDVLDMPEYLGGMSRDMNVQQVTQTTENDYGNLGDFSGQAWIQGNMEYSITHFCDEEGFVIGLLSVDPIAPYTQVVPKFLLRESAFDYYSPEFGKIGMQPILNREIAPLQSFYEKNGDHVFGYQRAWYDMLDGLSEVHGKFRTDFRNFIISRTFNSVPKLGEDFLVMSDDDINNIFYVDDEEDKILGQILFEYESIMPIPVYGVPALE